jgi:peptidoglycan hydrolase-like protein with peptidoglycan-binding domain
MSKIFSRLRTGVTPKVVLLCCLISAFVGFSASSALAASESGPTRGNALIWPVLKKGAGNTPVRALQYLLRSKGCEIVIDGKFGSQTEGAVKRYQRARKLKVDGIVGAYTWESLVPALRRGSRGDAVRAAQTLVNWHFHDWSDAHHTQYGQIRVDGDFGKVTERAMRTFQEGIGIITVNGRVNDATWCYLSGGRLDGE